MRWGRHIYKDKYGGLNQAGRAKTRELSSEHKKLSAINTLSKKGVKRLEDVEKEYEHLTGRPISAHAAEKIGIKTPKRVDEMTNEELTAYNTRKQLETSYQGYQPKAEISRGKKIAKSVIGTPFNKVLMPVAIDLGKAYLKSVGMKKLGLKEEKKKDKTD